MEDFEIQTVEELAKALKVKPSWVYGETRKTGPGTIPRIKVGKYIRFRLLEVLAWLEERGK
ncbi:MAG: helix-turn-helix domain-containing protein [Deltaproteobacteria bacterium]|nr:helix-turn-helix domain-containing protein [Deltaproteobacteria bacterium]MBM4295623.1 helix-turn-helix domain-containing protein [Deltaproteobacteria bacterium]